MKEELIVTFSSFFKEKMYILYFCVTDGGPEKQLHLMTADHYKPPFINTPYVQLDGSLRFTSETEGSKEYSGFAMNIRSTCEKRIEQSTLLNEYYTLQKNDGTKTKSFDVITSELPKILIVPIYSSNKFK